MELNELKDEIKKSVLTSMVSKMNAEPDIHKKELIRQRVVSMVRNMAGRDIQKNKPGYVSRDKAFGKEYPLVDMGNIHRE